MKILVPFRLPEPENFSSEFISLLANSKVFVLGCYQIPEQTSPEQARESFGDEMQKGFDEIVEKLNSASNITEADLVFTPDLLKTVESVAEDYEIDAVVTPRDIQEASEIFVLLAGDGKFQQLSQLLVEIASSATQKITIVKISEESEEADLILQGCIKTLVNSGIDEDIVETDVLQQTEQEELMSQIEKHDAVVLGERELTFENAVLGPVSNKLIVEQTKPVFVVRLTDDDSS